MDKPTVIVVARSSIHTSDAILDKIEEWFERGIIIFELPPYSPQLNLIEILWRFMKYQWIEIDADKTWETFVAFNELPRRKRTGYQNQKRVNCSSGCNWKYSFPCFLTALQSFPHPHACLLWRLSYPSLQNSPPHNCFFTWGHRLNTSGAVRLLIIVTNFVTLYVGTDWIKKCTRSLSTPSSINLIS